MYKIETVLEIIFNSDVLDNAGKFNPDLSFKENGIDSLDIFTILLAIEERLNIKFSENETIQIKSARDILNILNKPSAP